MEPAFMKHHPKKAPKLYCNFPVEELQTRYIRGYHYNFWVNKARALMFFIDNPDKIDLVQSENKEDTTEYLIENFKMDIHMMLFHCTESLFLNVFAAIYNPEQPWVFLAKCSAPKLYTLIKTVSEQGLQGLLNAPPPGEFMQGLMYPSIDKSHAKWDSFKKTSEEVPKYLKRLAAEYIDHDEYNSYKHGLRCFPGLGTLKMTSEQTNKVVMQSKSNMIEYIAFKDEVIDKEPHQRVMITDKTFDHKRDFAIMETNTAIMLNIFHKRKVDLDPPEKRRPTYFYFILKDDAPKLTDLFKFDVSNSMGGFVTKFSV